MGYHLFREVKRHAPADLDTGELALLLILADEANDATRECFPGMDEICRWMRMSADGVGRVLQRLAKHGLEVRVPVGEDKTGRTIYAKKGVQTTYRLPRFDTAMPGPRSDHNANGRTSVRPKTDSRPDAGPGIAAPWPDAGQSMGGPQSGPSPQFPQREVLSPQRADVPSVDADAPSRERTSTDDDTNTILTAYAEALGRPVTNGTRSKLADQARTLLAEGYPVAWLADRAREMAPKSWTDLEKHAERSTVPLPAPKRPKHCGRCNPDTRLVEDDGPPYRCPKCHPLAARAA